MRKFALALFVVVIVGLAVSLTGSPDLAQSDQQQPMTIRGEIWDSTCAAASTHAKMMAKMEAKDAKECTLNCVKAGAQFVLLNPDDKTIYRLDSQDKVKEYAGQMVTVIGTFDRSTGILHVDRIESVT